MKKIFLALMLMAIIISCRSLPKFGKKQTSIVNTQWTLAEAGSSPKVATLNVETNRISGTGGCNNYFADVVLNAKNGSFVAGSVGSTRMACTNMTSEQNFFDLLAQVNRYNLNNGVLELYKDNLLLLRFNQTNKK